MSWLDPVRAALDDAPQPCPVFFRDDDAGWADDRLVALLDRFERYGVPVDVAVIPAEVTPGLVQVLRGRMKGSAVRIHQHGYAHVNHEPAGRKCEFGAARDLDAQLTDIEKGQQSLADAFGDQTVDSVFTPPWNRCTPDTGRALVAAGIDIISRDATAGRLDLPGLREIPVTVDWFAKRKGSPLSRPEIADQIAGSVATGGPVGVMLHHAVTDDGELDVLESLLALVATHRGAAPTALVALAP